MLVKHDAVKLLEAFSASVLKLTDDIAKEAERINKEDPDPERTKAHMVDKKLRGWFNVGGYMGYR